MRPWHRTLRAIISSPASWSTFPSRASTSAIPMRPCGQHRPPSADGCGAAHGCLSRAGGEAGRARSWRLRCTGMWRPTQGARRAGRRRREAEMQKAYQSSDPWMTLVGRRRGRWGKVVAAKMETPESILRRLEFKVVRRLDGLLFGDYTGMFYGPSLDLAEVREYQPGDEVRRIDWNVTARMHRLFLRQYPEERELTAWLPVD